MGIESLSDIFTLTVVFVYFYLGGFNEFCSASYSRRQQYFLTTLRSSRPYYPGCHCTVLSHWTHLLLCFRSFSDRRSGGWRCTACYINWSGGCPGSGLGHHPLFPTL